PSNFQLSVQDSSRNSLVSFPGSAIGTNIPLSSGPSIDDFFVVEGNHPNFVPTFNGDCTKNFGANAGVRLEVGREQSCIVTNRHVGSMDNNGQADRVLEIQTVVDSTGDPHGKQSSDFLITIGPYLQTHGSATGIYYGLLGAGRTCNSFNNCSDLNQFD